MTQGQGPGWGQQQPGWGPQPPGWGPPRNEPTPGWNQTPNEPTPSGWGQPTDQPSDQPPASGWGQQPPGATPPGWTPPPPPGQPSGPTKYCPACGSVIDSRSVDCPRCGVRQPDVVYREARSRPLAILLALLLGTFGVHRFYVGPVAWGIAYLVFFWTGIPGFLAWLEAIYWLTRSDAEWARTYGGPVQASNGCAIGCLWVLALLPLILIGLAIAAIPGLILLGGEIESILSEIEVQLTFAPLP